MTVTYIHKVPSASKMGAFLRLLAIWRGSVVKGIWKDLAAFCLMYTAISVSYRYCTVVTVLYTLYTLHCTGTGWSKTKK